MSGVRFSIKGEKTKIGYIPIYRKGFENKINIKFLSTPNIVSPICMK